MEIGVTKLKVSGGMKNKVAKVTEKELKAEKAIDERSEVINDTWAVLQGKAKPSIIAYLASGKRRLTHITEEMKGINTRELSSELKVLEKNALIRKIEVGTMPVIIEYELTPDGQALKKILDELHHWALAKRKKEAATDTQ